MKSKFRWLRVSAYPSLILFLAMGVFGTLFAWNSYNLLHQGMASYHFIQQYGSLAIMEGGLLQMVHIVGWGLFCLALYIGFKACEAELVARWRSRNEE